MFKKFLIGKLINTIRKNVNFTYGFDVTDKDGDKKPEINLTVSIFDQVILDQSIEFPFKLVGFDYGKKN